jgi:cysteine dioxygenase
MQAIQTIEQLIDSLNDTEPSEQGSVLKRIEIPTADFEEFATWNKGEYTRNCIERTNEYELILICWDAAAITPIHCHDGQDCWVYQLHGNVIERRYASNNGVLSKTNEMNLQAGRMTFMHDRMGYHSIENPNDQKAMTLHLYASPIDECSIYNPKSKRFERVELSYDTNPNVSISA